MASESRPAWVRRMTGTYLRLQGSNCQDCKIVHFPARVVCPDCGHNAQKPATGKEEETTLPQKVEVFVAK